MKTRVYFLDVRVAAYRKSISRAVARLLGSCALLLALLPQALAVTCAALAAEMASPRVRIELSPERRQLIGVTFTTVKEKELTDTIEATGVIEPDEQLKSFVQTRVHGWIREVFVNQTYQLVRKGQPLLTIYSPELVSAENDFLIALRASEQLAQSPIEGVSESAKSLVDATLKRLRLYGVSPQEIARLRRERTVRDYVEIDSPSSGYVIERAAFPNMYVQPETRLYTIVNLSTVWVYVAVFQDRLGELALGTPALVSVDTYPGRVFRGKVDFIWQALDPQTRTAKVRCAFPNPGGLLKLGMYVSVNLKPTLGRALVIPESGVLRTGSHDIAFVDEGDGYLRPVEVELGAHVGHEFVVRKGLRAGDRIVNSANFLIDSESQLQAALGTFVPPPPGASAAAIAPSGKIDFTTDPNPPRKGANQVLIAVRDSTGRPVTDAEVSVVFFMPAMPAMGMSAMRVEATAKPTANGIYAAPVTLQSGGTWTVTVVAKKGGKTVASTQLNVSATGGM